MSPRVDATRLNASSRLSQVPRRFSTLFPRLPSIGGGEETPDRWRLLYYFPIMYGGNAEDELAIFEEPPADSGPLYSELFHTLLELVE